MVIQRITGGTTPTPQPSTGKGVISRISTGSALQAPTPVTQPVQTPPVQITPTQKKIDPGKIGSTLIAKAKEVAPVVIKGLSFALALKTKPIETIKNVVKAPGTETPVLPKAKEVKKETPKPLIDQKVKDSVVNLFTEVVKAGGVKAIETKFAKDIIKGFFRESSAQIEKAGGQNFAGNPNAEFKTTNAGEATGKVVYGLLRDITAFEAGGINAAFEGGIKSLTGTLKASTKVAVIQDTLEKFASKEFASFLNKLKPLKLTIQDLQDVTTGKGTTEQMVRFNKAMQLKDKGIPIKDILEASQRSKVNPATKLYDFLSDAITNIKNGLKSSLTPEEQKLLSSGTKSKLEQIIPPGEYTSQEVAGKIISNGLEKTPEGKQIIKMAFDAQTSGKSIVVDTAKVTETLKPITAYHGTDEPLSKSIDKSGYHPGTYFTTNKEMAGKFANIAGNKPVVKEVSIDLKNPYIVKNIEYSYGKVSPEKIRTLQKQGYDGILVKRTNGDTEVVPFDKKNITSIVRKPKSPQISAKPPVPSPTRAVSPPQAQKVVSPTDKFQSRVFQRLKMDNPQLEGQLGYDPIKLEKEARKAVNLIATDKQKAFRIAMEAETSKDVTSTAVNIALAEKALDEGNNSLYARLVKARSLNQTRRGQELVSEKGSVNDNGTSRYVKELISTRLDKLGKRYLGDLTANFKGKSTKERATQAIDREVEKVRTKIKNKDMDITEAQSLLDKLICK